jgi:hypothetical protein
MEAQIPDSPYAPPRAAVADIEDDSAPPERPPLVGRAMKCLWTSWALGLVSALYSFVFPPAVQPMGPYFAIGSAAVGALFSAWLYGKLSRGRNWARVLMLIFGVFSIFSIPMILVGLRAGTMGPVAMGAGVITFSLHFYVYYLLLTRTVREWYYAMKGRA